MYVYIYIYREREIRICIYIYIYIYNIPTASRGASASRRSERKRLTGPPAGGRSQSQGTKYRIIYTIILRYYAISYWDIPC